MAAVDEAHPAVPQDANAVRPVTVGTLAWIIAFVVLLAIGDRLPDGASWWVWVPVVGTALGGLGMIVTRRRLR